MMKVENYPPRCLFLIASESLCELGQNICCQAREMAQKTEGLALQA